jgi:hypothetical protein
MAVEKARLTEQEKARLAAEGAKQTEQARAAAAARAAEDARLAAEKAKQIEQEKATAAEKARIAEQEKARLAAEKAKQIEQEKAAAGEKTAAEKKEQLAALPAPAQKPEQQAQVDLPRALQAELRRVGCSTGAVDGNWNTASQRALELFNKHAGLKLEAKAASVDALDAVKGKTGRICPLVCDHGFRADGERCVKITCRAGYRINDDNDCEKVPEKKPVATREEAKPQRDTERIKSDTAPAKPQASGQIICDTRGCRPVGKGCRIEQTKIGLAHSGGAGSGNLTEVCN